MQGEFVFKGKKIFYTKKKSARAKRIKITIKTNGAMNITIPKHLSYRSVDKFIIQKSDWILKNIERLKKENINLKKEDSIKEYEKNKEQARKLITERVSYFNFFLNFKYNSISIKNQKTRWGSCSAKSNLNFNYKLLFLPQNLRDYIIVHELSHLEELNHSERFHKIIESVISGHKTLEKELKKYRIN